MSARGRGRDAAIDLAILVALKVAVGVWVLHGGFTHVSDDDYARVVIAEAFAHAPKLDPSGTSWLPFPFWLNGVALALFGRSLAVARGVALVTGAVSVGAPYAAMRVVGCGRVAALAAVTVAMLTPWSAWLGVATVPEAMTACLVAAGAIAVTAPRARPFAAAGLLAAALSRYEAWPACAVFALACAWPTRGTVEADRRLGARAVPIALAAAGPLAWMAWNVHAHGSAVHFLARVAAYRQAIGAAPASLHDRLTEFPWAVVTASPFIVLAAAGGAVALAIDAGTRARWAWPLASALAILVFLVVGDVRDGAPTHHPERAVVPIAWILAAFAADALDVLAHRGPQPRWIAGALAVAALTWCATLPGRWDGHPAMSPAESRDAQIARGLALRAEAGAAAEAPARVVVTPCAYEHFALIAAFGAPERVDIAAATHAPVTDDCPRVMR